MSKKETLKPEVQEQKPIIFRLPETVEFPSVIFADSKDMEEIRKGIYEHFVAVNEKNVIANRVMDTDEINDIRAEYGDIAEQQLPELYDELGTLEAKFKSDKKQIEAKIAAANTRFKDLVSFAKSGIKDFPLEMENTFRIPVLNHYLYYTWINNRFELAMVQEIPYHERRDIFNSVERNKAAFENLGYTLPEIEINDPRENLRRFSGEGYDYEVYEEKGQIIVQKFWVEDFLDEDTGNVTSINRSSKESYSPEDYPYAHLENNEQTEAQEGASEQLPEEPEE